MRCGPFTCLSDKFSDHYKVGWPLKLVSHLLAIAVQANMILFSFTNTYRSSKTKHICKFSNNFPFETCVPHCALVKITRIDKNNIFVFNTNVINCFLEPCYSTKTLSSVCNVKKISKSFIKIFPVTYLKVSSVCFLTGL